MTFEELILKNIIFIVGLAVHALYTYWDVGKLKEQQKQDEIHCEKRFTELEIRVSNNTKMITTENKNLVQEIGKLREEIAGMKSILELLVKSKDLK